MASNDPRSPRRNREVSTMTARLYVLFLSAVLAGGIGLAAAYALVHWFAAIGSALAH